MWLSQKVGTYFKCKPYDEFLLLCQEHKVLRAWRWLLHHCHCCQWAEPRWQPLCSFQRRDGGAPPHCLLIAWLTALSSSAALENLFQGWLGAPTATANWWPCSGHSKRRSQLDHRLLVGSLNSGTEYLDSRSIFLVPFLLLLLFLAFGEFLSLLELHFLIYKWE